MLSSDCVFKEVFLHDHKKQAMHTLQHVLFYWSSDSALVTPFSRGLPTVQENKEQVLQAYQDAPESFLSKQVFYANINQYKNEADKIETGPRAYYGYY